MAEVARLDFCDGKGPRKLKARNRYLIVAIRESGKSITELANDPIFGYAYLVRALVNGGAEKPISLDQSSALIDAYLDAGNQVDGLGEALIKSLTGYLHLEQTKPEDEDSDAPNAGSQGDPGHSKDSTATSTSVSD
jgi:hypothetical protein